MTMSTFHKVTLVSCIFLCISLLLPKMLLFRGKKEFVQPKVGPGHFPPTMRRHFVTESQAQGEPAQISFHAHSPDLMVKSRAGGLGTGQTGKSSLMERIIPVYGFGILLYILYILFTITSKGKNSKPDNGLPAVESETLRRKMTEHELAKLQEKLKEAEEAMEHIVCKANRRSKRVKSVTLQREEKLLRQLREVTRMMQESRQAGAVSPEMEAEQTHYAEDWEGYPEETFPQYDEPSSVKRYSTVILEVPGNTLPTAEEQAERMEAESDMEELEEDLTPVKRGEEETGPDKWEEMDKKDGKREGGQDGEEERDEDEEEDLDEADQEEEVGPGGTDKAEEENAWVVGEVERNGEGCVQDVQDPTLELMKGGELEQAGMRSFQGRKEGKQISFSNTKEVFRYSVESSDDNDIQDAGWLKAEDELEEDEEEDEDPVVMAESLTFTSDAYAYSTPEQQQRKCEAEEQEEQDTPFESEEEASDSERAEDASSATLRKRNKGEPE